MFQGRINFDDLVFPPVLTDKGIFFGASYVYPFEHRLLFTDFLRGQDCIAIISCERFADEPGD